jgi:O-antigen/teichoic acid export membrane protein
VPVPAPTAAAPERSTAESGSGATRRGYALGVAGIGYGKLVLAFVQLVLIPVLALHWGLALYGQWIMISTIPSFLMMSDFGFGTAASTRVMAELARGEEDAALQTFQSAWALILALTAATAILIVIASAAVPEHLLAIEGGMSTGDVRLVLALMGLYGLLCLQQTLFVGIARAAGRQGEAYFVLGTVTLVEGLLVAGLVVLGASPAPVAACYLAVRCAGMGFQVLTTRRWAGWLRLGFGSAHRERVRELMSPAIAIMVLPISQAIYLQGAAIVIGIAGSSAMVPIYTALRTLSRVGVQVMASLSIPAMPGFAAAKAVGDEAAARLIALRLGMTVFAVGLVAAAVLALAGEWILQVWTRGAISAPALMIDLFAVAIFLHIVWAPLSDLLVAQNRHHLYSYAYLVLAGVSGVLTWVLVRAFGVTGAAAANLALEIPMLCVVLFSLNRSMPVVGARAGLAGRA